VLAAQNWKKFEAVVRAEVGLMSREMNRKTVKEMVKRDLQSREGVRGSSDHSAPKQRKREPRTVSV
jgi:hypothetical protein